MNPLSRLLAAVIGVLVLAGAFFFGLFVLAVAAGLGVLAWLSFRLRLWWLRRTAAGRRSAAGPHDPPDSAGRSRNDNVIDAEYTVVSRRDDD